MKKLIFVLIAFAVSHAASSQDWSTSVYKNGERYPGYIVKLNGDTVQGYIQYVNRFENQKEVKFFSDPKDKKTKVEYKAEDLKGYKMADKVYRSIAYSGGLMGKPIRFVLILKDGRIAQYTWYDRHENYLTMVKGPNETQEEFEKRYYPEKAVYVKADEKPFDNSNFGLKFAKFWAETTSDYPELSAKIANKDKGYGLINMYEFIDEYNAWWKKNKK